MTGKKILGKRCFNENILDNDGRIMLYLPDELLDPTIWTEEQQWFRLLQAGPECKYLNNEMLKDNRIFAKFALYGDGIHYIGESLWIIEENKIYEAENACPFFYIEEE